MKCDLTTALGGYAIGTASMPCLSLEVERWKSRDRSVPGNR